MNRATSGMTPSILDSVSQVEREREREDSPQRRVRLLLNVPREIEDGARGVEQRLHAGGLPRRLLAAAAADVQRQAREDDAEVVVCEAGAQRDRDVRGPLHAVPPQGLSGLEVERERALPRVQLGLDGIDGLVVGVAGLEGGGDGEEGFVGLGEEASEAGVGEEPVEVAEAGVGDAGDGAADLVVQDGLLRLAMVMVVSRECWPTDGMPALKEKSFSSE